MQTLVVTIEKSENKASWQISPIALSCRRKFLSFFQHLAFRKSGCPNDCFNQDPPPMISNIGADFHCFSKIIRNFAARMTFIPLRWHDLVTKQYN